MNYQKFSLVFGFSVWLLATLIVRYWGHYFLKIENNLGIGAFFIGAVPILYILAKSVFNWFKLTEKNRLKSTILMTLPGMFCDVLCIKYHYIAFPKLTIEQSIVLGAWVIWAYSIVLILGLIITEEKKTA